MLVVWRPDLQQYTAYVTKEVDKSVPSTGGVIQLELPKIAAQALGAALGAWQADVKVCAICNESLTQFGKCCASWWF